MKPTIFMTALLTLLAVPCARSSDVVERDTVKQTLKFTAAGSRRIVVDNINGSIDVTGYDGSDVELVACRKIRAESDSRLGEAKKNVTLETKEDGDRILVYVDAPWRSRDGSVNHQGWDYYGYEVDYHFELKVPAKTDFTLKTVNGGDITAAKMAGTFEIRNVNGGIEIREVGGSGKATTVNGNIGVTFAGNPAEACTFRTVNGNIDLEFAGKLSANLRFKTMNGDVYTDFRVKEVPQGVMYMEKRGGRKVYRSRDSFVVQAGDGGPELGFETLNGSIYLSVKGEHQ